MSCNYIKDILIKYSYNDTVMAEDGQRPESISIQHTDLVCDARHTFGKDNRTQRCYIVPARTTPGYGHMWHVIGREPVPDIVIARTTPGYKYIWQVIEKKKYQTSQNVNQLSATFSTYTGTAGFLKFRSSALFPTEP